MSTLETATEYWKQIFAKGGRRSLNMPAVLHEYAESLGRGKTPLLKPLEWEGLNHSREQKDPLVKGHYLIEWKGFDYRAYYRKNLALEEIGFGTKEDCQQAVEDHRNALLQTFLQ